jgi:hypothetical protein
VDALRGHALDPTQSSSLRVPALPWATPAAAAAAQIARSCKSCCMIVASYPLWEANSSGRSRYVHVFARFRPQSLLSYEHMFPLGRTSTFRQHALDALHLARSFLLLEDDYHVDWEVGQDEHLGVDHPHRALLRGRAIGAGRSGRRPGQPEPTPHVCLSPVNRPGSSLINPRGRHQQQGHAHRDLGAATASSQLANGNRSTLQARVEQTVRQRSRLERTPAGCGSEQAS